MFFLGITAGRALSGFLTMKLSDAQMIRLGQAVIACGVAALLLPVGVITVAVLVIVMAVSGLTAQHILLHSSPKEGARHE